MSETARCDLCENTLIFTSELIDFLREWAEEQEQKYFIVSLHFFGHLPIYTTARVDEFDRDEEPALSYVHMCNFAYIIFAIYTKVNSVFSPDQLETMN